jgi:hypothetical protein
VTKTVTQAVEELVRATVGMSDADMGREWKWGVYDEEGLRFALLMTHHELRDLAVRLAARAQSAPTQANRILAQYHQTYRDLTGVVAGVRAEDLDRAPAEGEWPLREALIHMIGAEHGFLSVSKIALDRHRAGKPDEPSDEEWSTARAPYAEARKASEDAVRGGDLAQIRDAFAAIHIRVLREFADISDEEIELPAWFWDGAMPIRFRLHRFEEHLRQHTIQLDKTLAVIRPPTEAHRLIRNIYNALADMETADEPAESLRTAVADVIADRASAINA